MDDEMKLETMNELELVDLAHKLAAECQTATLALNSWAANTESVKNCPWLDSEQLKLFKTLKLLEQDSSEKLKSVYTEMMRVVKELSKRDLVKE